MSWRRTDFMLASIGICGLLAADVATVRSARADDKCKPVHGTIITHLTDPATCQSPFLLCTAGKIVGAGPLNGASTFTTLGLAPSAGMPGVVPPTTLSYAGALVITTRHGQIQLGDVGILDQGNLVFTEIDQVQGGTGSFAGKTGTWFISGPIIDNGTGFRGEIDGQLCDP